MNYICTDRFRTAERNRLVKKMSLKNFGLVGDGNIISVDRQAELSMMFMCGIMVICRSEVVYISLCCMATSNDVKTGFSIQMHAVICASSSTTVNQTLKL